MRNFGPITELHNWTFCNKDNFFAFARKYCALFMYNKFYIYILYKLFTIIVVCLSTSFLANGYRWAIFYTQYPGSTCAPLMHNSKLTTQSEASFNKVQ